MNDDVSKLSEQTCCALTPEYYDGVLEALRIQQINDAEIDPFVASIMRFFRNAYIQTADDDVISEYENELDISPAGTIQDRRQAVIDKINSDFILNDEELINTIHSIPGCEDVDYKVDSEFLTLRIKKETNIEDEDEAEDLKKALTTVLPIVPLNLDVNVAVISNNSISITASYGWINHMHSNLGQVSWHKPIYDLQGFDMSNNSDVTVQYDSTDSLIKCDSVLSGEWVDVDDFYTNQNAVAVKKLSYTMYYGDTPVTIYADDCEEPSLFTASEIPSSFETWRFE